MEGVAAAALYGACRRCEVPRTLTEITEASRASKKEVEELTDIFLEN